MNGTVVFESKCKNTRWISFKNSSWDSGRKSIPLPGDWIYIRVSLKSQLQISPQTSGNIEILIGMWRRMNLNELKKNVSSPCWRWLWIFFHGNSPPFSTKNTPPFSVGIPPGYFPFEPPHGLFLLVQEFNPFFAFSPIFLYLAHIWLDFYWFLPRFEGNLLQPHKGIHWNSVQFTPSTEGTSFQLRLITKFTQVVKTRKHEF